VVVIVIVNASFAGRSSTFTNAERSEVHPSRPPLLSGCLDSASVLAAVQARLTRAAEACRRRARWTCDYPNKLSWRS
jgi:hypothetical protein